jgi:major membrane immunogen (membrane-anchored lipoprotein)
MKNVLIVLLIVGLLVATLGLTACSHSDDSSSSTDNSASINSSDSVSLAVDDQLIDDSDSVEIGSMV